MAHPLSGANLGTLMRAFSIGGRPDRWGASAGIWGAALARAPASMLERLLVDRHLPRLDDLPPPVFILGHWRSGTTHLYNVMSRGGFGYVPPIAVGLPWDMFGIARAFGPLLERALPETRWIDRISVTPTSPQEDEIGIASMTDVSFYHGIYFPRKFDHLIDRGLFFDGCAADDIHRWETRFKYFLRKIAHDQKQRLLIKNPVYTGRVSMLLRLFPQAKFIHIHRNPFDVFLSMRNFYRKLLEVMALQDLPSNLDIDATILRVYDRMMTKYIQDTADLGEEQLTEIPYARLDKDPLGVIEEIYASLNLGEFDDCRPAFSRYLSSVESFEKNAFRGDAATIALVANHWKPWIDRWRYTVPDMTAQPA